MQKIVLAPDKFKGSISSLAFCKTVERGIRKYCDAIEIIHCPLADGGDGTVEVLRYYLGGKMISTKVNNPVFEPIKASYLLSANGETAYIEMAAASGLRLLTKKQHNPLLTSSYGTGELIKHAINNGAKQIILGIGGSATNDGGLGMASALGYVFLDINNKPLKCIGQDLLKLHHFDDACVLPALKTVDFKVACDVTNPLYGNNGAAHIYAAQKGANKQTIEKLDKGLQHFAKIILQKKHIDLQQIAGAGAAGGLGAGSIVFLNAQLQAGIDLIMQQASYTNKTHHADWIITGEGQLDSQSLSGKVIDGIIRRRNNQKLAVFCGSNQLAPAAIQSSGFNHIAEITSYAPSLKASLQRAEHYLQLAAEDFAKRHLIKQQNDNLNSEI